MNPQVNGTSGLDLPQPGSETSQLPTIHAPQTFHAPDGSLPQFGVATSPLPNAPAPATTQSAPAPAVQPAAATPPSVLSQDPIAVATAQLTSNSMPVVQAEDIDTPFDEEWVAKAKEIVARTHIDPFTQSKELSKLKAQYIKARYNKDIKVSE